MIRYRKLKSGAWGIGGPADAIKAGARVTVHKADGTKKEETVDQVIAGPFPDGNVLASIRASTAAPARRRSYGSRRGGGCHTDGNCSSMCSPKSCPCGDGAWFTCC